MNKLILIMLMLSGCGSSPYGVVGPQGATGTTGQSGTSCTVTNVAIGQPGAPNGGSLISCPDGTSQVVLNGSPGTNGSSIAMIQFCPGYTTTYPAIFPEFGVCSSNNIYAVYYDKTNAWLAEIAPGYYSSTSTNAPCNFMVGPDCEIVN